MIPQGRVQTGSDYGNPYISYVEYMTAAIEPRPAIGGGELFLDDVTFKKNHHGQTVHKLFDEVLVGTKDTPCPIPTHSDTNNFNLTNRGARLVDGQCNLTAKTEDESVLVLHSADQLAYIDTALAMLTTNTSFRFYSSSKHVARGKVTTSICETKKYKLGSVTDSRADNDAGTKWLDSPTSFLTSEKGVTHRFVEDDKYILEIWSALRSEVRTYVCGLVQALDWLAKAISDMNIKKVGAEHVSAFHRGSKEPGFLASDVPDFKMHRQISEQEKFVYCHHTMEGEQFAKDNAAGHEFLYKVFKHVSDSNPQISDSLKKLVDEGVDLHRKQSH